ncbi:MAG: carboxypeptidase-like regulatory domain-containing protein [Gemmatimonadota bacterium]
MVLGLALLAPLPASLEAQSIHGRVVDSATGAAIEGAHLRLLDVGGESVAITLSDSAGAFVFRLEQAGVYRLQAIRLGYEEVHTQEIRVGNRDRLDVVVRMSVRAVELDPLEVRGRGLDARQRATYEGLYLRAAEAYPVGPSRVVLHEGPEMRSAIRISDVMRWFTGSGAYWVYWNGRLVPHIQKEFFMQTPVVFIEGIEFYKDYYEAPMEMQGDGGCEALRCSVLALWSLRPDAVRALSPDGRDPAPGHTEPPPTLPDAAPLDATIEILPPAPGFPPGTVQGSLAATDIPAVGVIELLGATGERFDIARIDDSGGFTLRAPGPGSYVLRLMHAELGARNSAGFELGAGERAAVVVRLR